MDSIGVRELRQNASKYLHRVAAGESLTVTERGKPVAVLNPPPPESTVYDELVAMGELIPAERPFGAMFLSPPLPAEAGVKPLSEVLREMRDEERY